MAVSSNFNPGNGELTTTGDDLDNTTGNDQLLGEAGNNRIIWSPGDGSDLTEGGTLGAIPGPDRSASLPKGTDTTIPAATTRHRELPPLAPHRFAVWCNRSGNIRTPRLLRPRVTSRWQVSWLTGHRRRPPSREHAPFSVALLVEGSPLTVAGAAAALCKCTHRVPF